MLLRISIVFIEHVLRWGLHVPSYKYTVMTCSNLDPRVSHLRGSKMIDPGNEVGRIIAFCSESDRFFCRKRKTVCASDSMENGRFLFTHLREQILERVEENSARNISTLAWVRWSSLL